MTSGVSCQSITHWSTLAGPVLDIDWSDDGTKLFAACADKTVRAWDLASNQQVPVGQVGSVGCTSHCTPEVPGSNPDLLQHDSAVNTVHYTPIGGAQMIMTTGWDKTIKFWDMRTSPTGQPGELVAARIRFCQEK